MNPVDITINNGRRSAIKLAGAAVLSGAAPLVWAQGAR
jgi:hypothetical protein